MSEFAIKIQSGLGDAIYAYPIAKYFAAQHDTLHVMSDYDEVFATIPNVVCHRHLKLNFVSITEGDKTRKKDIDIRFSYGPGKYKPGTSQYEDMLVFGRTQNAVIPDMELKMPWEEKNNNLIETIGKLAKGKKVAIVAAPYQPFGRTDKWGGEITINTDTMERVVQLLKDMGYLTVEVGNKFCLYKLNAEVKLVGETTVSDLFDLASMSDLLISQVGNFIPLAEAFRKKNIILFSKRILTTDKRFLAAIKPEKVIHYKNLNYSFYDDKLDVQKLNAFCK